MGIIPVPIASSAMRKYRIVGFLAEQQGWMLRQSNLCGIALSSGYFFDNDLPASVPFSSS